MKRLLYSLILCPLLAATMAEAAVFERDWQSLGDGLLTYDDVNQREWLDLSLTLLEQFPGTTLEDRYQNVVDETGPGGMFDGFAVAVSDDITALAQSAGIVTSSGDFNINRFQTLELISLLTATDIRSTEFETRVISLGALNEMETGTSSPKRIFGNFIVEERVNFSDVAGLGIETWADLVSSTTAGVYLIRQVPEPEALILVTSFLSGHLGIHQFYLRGIAR